MEYETFTGNSKRKRKKQNWSWRFSGLLPTPINSPHIKNLLDLTCGCHHIYYTIYLASPRQGRESYCGSRRRCREHLKFLFTQFPQKSAQAGTAASSHFWELYSLQFSTHFWTATLSLHGGEADVILLANMTVNN